MRDQTEVGPGAPAGSGAHAGRFAPSPTGPLHLGNLRTALLAWLFARAAGDRFVVRMEDLDRTNASPAHEATQLADLAALGLDWDGPVLRQSERFDRYRDAIGTLDARGLVYPCYCTRREIREAAAAPHGLHPDGAYPGTCRALTTAQRARREAEGRRPALRLRAGGREIRFVDRICGPTTGVVDDVVLCRNDGVPAYNLAVVVDDDAQGVGEVVRGDDLLSSTPRQLWLIELLGLRAPTYAHVPLVLGADGARLAKRHGAVTLADLAAQGTDAAATRSLLGNSLGLSDPGEAVDAATLLARFRARGDATLPRAPWVLTR
jgi:glutamyl-tRNA synthetase